MWRAALTALLLLGSTLPALAARIDIDDPALLGPVLFSEDYGDQHDAHWIAEVRYAAGVYSYVYAIQTSPSFPYDENELFSVAIGGTPLESTWGAIHGSDAPWPHDGLPTGQTNQVGTILAFPLGFWALPVFAPEFTYTVIYAQSFLPPKTRGVLEYVAIGLLNGQRGIGFTGANGVLAPFSVPVPEPGSIFLLGAGLTAWALQRRRRNAPSA